MVQLLPPCAASCFTGRNVRSCKGAKKKKKYSEEIHVDSDNMVPPAVGLCLAFVLIPSHRWVQARGPPTSSCQRRLRQRHSNMAVCLNYYSTLENTQQQARSWLRGRSGQECRDCLPADFGRFQGKSFIGKVHFIVIPLSHSWLSSFRNESFVITDLRKSLIFISGWKLFFPSSL